MGFVFFGLRMQWFVQCSWLCAEACCCWCSALCSGSLFTIITKVELTKWLIDSINSKEIGDFAGVIFDLNCLCKGFTTRFMEMFKDFSMLVTVKFDDACRYEARLGPLQCIDDLLLDIITVQYWLGSYYLTRG